MHQAWEMTRELLTINEAYIPHEPTGPQLLFLALPVLEAMFGGAAGGGKSDALLMAAAMFFHVPGYNALVLRRTYADLALPEAIMDRSRGWWGDVAHWSDKDKRWTFPSGATCTFGYVATSNDVYRYQGSAYQFIAFDELTQFQEQQYRYLFSRLRRAVTSGVPIRMRAASNPGGIGHEWVRQRFLTEGRAQGRIFVPAKLHDNPHVDYDEYLKSLNVLDPVTRAQLLFGDWTARNDGGFFKREWFPIVDAAPADVTRERRWDFAATEATGKNDPDWTVGALVSKTAAGRYFIEDVRRVRATPANVESLVKQTAALDGRGVSIYLEQEPGSAGKSFVDRYVTQVLAGYTVHGIRTTGPKEESIKPFSAQAEVGNVSLVRGEWIGAFLDEAEAWPMGRHDDQLDPIGKAVAHLAASLPLPGAPLEISRLSPWYDR